MALALKPTLQSTLSLLLAFAVLFLPVWTDEIDNPLALASTILVVIVSGGPSVGSTIRNSLSSFAGLCAGIAAFVVLAKIPSPIAQGAVWTLFVALVAYVRSYGLSFRPFFLVSILFGFQGIYTAEFSDALLAFVKSYALGIAIPLVVNLVLFPQTSHHNLRIEIVLSLENISSLSHLICKSFSKQIEPDEIRLRDHLTLAIRDDFEKLSVCLEETAYEVSFSRLSAQENREAVDRIRAMQQALITASSTLGILSDFSHIAHDSTFINFRHGVDLLIEDVIITFSGSQDIAFSPHVEFWRDAEAGQTVGRRRTFSQAISSTLATTATREGMRKLNQMSGITKRLRAEARLQSPPPSRSQTPLGRLKEVGRRSSSIDRGKEFIRSHRSESKEWESSKKISFFIQSFRAFSALLTRTVLDAIKDGSMHVGDTLQSELPQPSLQQVYASRLPKTWASSLAHPATITPVQPVDSVPLTRTFSFLYGFGQLHEELLKLHSISTTYKQRRTRIRFPSLRFALSFRQHSTNPFNIAASLAVLRGDRTFHKPSLSLGARFSKFEDFITNPQCRFSIKVALAALVYSIFFLAPSLEQSFFIPYGMTSSLITVIVGITPSLGQSYWTFLTQLSGTGIGAIYGLIVVEIFKTTTGYPFGQLVFLTLWAAPTSWILVARPKYFSVALLSMSAAGSAVILARLSTVVPPPLRTARTIAVMMISILITFLFQVFVFRAPARRELRLAIGSISSTLTSYNLLFQAYLNAVAPIDEATPPTTEALQATQATLIRQEIILQDMLIALKPLFEFAELEPKWASEFQGSVISEMIASFQTILDRMREARVASKNGFGVRVNKDFVTALAPYRFESQRRIRLGFRVVTSAIQSKTAGFEDVPSALSTFIAFERDALVLAHRLSRSANADSERGRLGNDSMMTNEGELLMSSTGYIHYWFYISSMNDIAATLERVEKLLGELFT